MEWKLIRKVQPEENQRVLVTIWARNRHVVRSGTYYHGVVHTDNGNVWMVGERGLIAWMPLPDPYKKGGVMRNECKTEGEKTEKGK